MHLLLIQTKEAGSDSIAKALNALGIKVVLSDFIGAQYVEIYRSKYATIILDCADETEHAFEFVRCYRLLDTNTPIIILSENDCSGVRVKSLELGADEFLSSKIDFAELNARLKSLLRRWGPDEANAIPRYIQVAGIKLDLQKREAIRSGQRIDLRPKEYLMLELFMKNPGRIFSKTELLLAIWGYEFDPKTNIVDVLLFRLRSKIDRDPKNKLIKNLRGQGYSFHG